VRKSVSICGKAVPVWVLLTLATVGAVAGAVLYTYWVNTFTGEAVTPSVTGDTFPATLEIPEKGGSVTVTDYTVTNNDTVSHTLQVVCDAYDVSGGALWSDIYTMSGDPVFVDGTIYSLTLGAGTSVDLKIVVGTDPATSSPYSCSGIHVLVSDYGL